jgi:hypothetical protein
LPVTHQSYQIALLVDDLTVPKWVRDFADWAANHPRIKLSALIVRRSKERKTAFDAILKLENRFALPSEYRPYRDLHSVADHAPAIILEGEGDEAEFRVREADLERIRELDLDAIVRCGGSIPKGRILDASRDGVLSVVTEADRSGPSFSGVDEVIRGCPATRFSIERVRDDHEPREILFEGSVATALLHSWNRIALNARAFPYLALVVERLATDGALPRSEPLAVGPLERSASPFKYAIASARRSLGKAVRRYSGQEFHWQVAFLREPWCSSDFARGRIIPNPRGAFLADPFTLNVDGVDYLFVEELPFRTHKGVISAYRIEGDEPKRIGVVLEEPYHLSFPFVFEHGREIYMVPESGAARSVTLYKSSSFPTGWKPVKVLLADVPAVDTILFQEGSLWWMLTTIQGDGPGLNNAELHAFYSDDLFGEWKPHRHNPIVMNASKGRNGGFLRDAMGRPYRVSQVPGFTFYGAGSLVHRIDELSPEVYRESLIKEVRPDFFPRLDGTHHIHSSGKLTVFDFMRVERPR